MSYNLSTKQIQIITRISSKHLIKETVPRHILQALHSHINQSAANVTRDKLKKAGFLPVNSLRVYLEEVVNPNYTETTQANGEPWINPAQTCALLGNSGILSGSKCGQEIDAHDHVFRSNMAKLEGFQEDVGTKTSLVTINNAAGRLFNWCLKNINDTCNKFVHQYLNKLDNSTIIWVSKACNGNIKLSTLRALRAIKPNIVAARPKQLLRPKIG
ncbi:beta-galactoside alpha-2,6-sialyltransferase 1-like, partial [Anneissia japonica]|uniref:beta-galactoside alpha-2,6-sialyltransferase 1-like n=1 Tax=Anneissia japonica TaxID=1529436 RepID=UPI001425515C